MKTQFGKPKGFSEILDLTFQITKNHFSSLFLILLLFMGPVFLIQALLELLSGRGFLRELVAGSNLLDQIINTYDQTAVANTSLQDDLIQIFIGLLAIILYPIASAAIFVLVKHIKNNESYRIGFVIKTAFSRFWPILWSSLLFGIIVFSIVFLPLIIVFTIGALVATASLGIGIVLIIIMVIGGIIGFGLLFTRWGFYLPAVVFDKVAPGLSKSWMLTNNRTWKLFGLYTVLFLIMSAINVAFDLPASLLGQSVLYGIIMNFVTLITTLFFTVGHAIMYFDAETRNTAGDLKELINEFQETRND